jgi:hypothetical protein
VESRTRVDFRWRYAPRVELDKELLQYIKQHPAFSLTEMMLAALRAFWLPMAIAHNPGRDLATKQQITRGCVNALLRQADSLCTAVELELPARRQGFSLNDWSVDEKKQPSQPVGLVSQSSVSSTSVSSLSVSELTKSLGNGEFDDSALAEW